MYNKGSNQAYKTINKDNEMSAREEVIAMLRVAIVDSEEVAKDIMFELALLLEKQEWSFQYFNKISKLAKVEQEKEFQIIIFHEKFEQPRITQSFVLNKPQRIIIYTKNELNEAEREVLPFARIFYIQRKEIKKELGRIAPYIERLLKNQEEYIFSYNNLKVPLKVNDIFYIEKDGKYIIYHTKRGEFRERKSMKEAFVQFQQYHFLWIHSSYLVNLQYVTQIETNSIVLLKERLPIARGRMAEIMDSVRKYRD